MPCTLCGRDMLLAGNFYICGHHETLIKIPYQTSAEKWDPLIGSLPAPIAILLAEYGEEKESPYVILHRLCDTAEMITRFFAVVALSYIYQRLNDFPKALKKILVLQMARPTFGSWKTITHEAFRLLGDKKYKLRSPFIEPFEEMWNKHLSPWLGSGNGDPKRQVIALRNLLAHSGRIPSIVESELLDTHAPLFREMLGKLSFLSRYSLVASIHEGEHPYLLKGAFAEKDSFYERYETDRFTMAPNHIYLIQDEEIVNLSPLSSFEELFSYYKQGTEPVVLMYFRYDESKLKFEFTALAPHHSFAQKGASYLDAFTSIYNLDKWKQELQSSSSQEMSPYFQFDDLREERLRSFVGRDEVLKRFVSLLSAPSERDGMIFVRGKPGTGKSSLLFKLEEMLKDKPVIAYYFRAGDFRSHPDYFYRYAANRMNQLYRMNHQLGGKTFQQHFNQVAKEASFIHRDAIFVIDGLDEVLAAHPDFESTIRYLAQLKYPILCAGRSVPTAIPATVFELEGLTEDEIRAYFDLECSRERYDLYRRDVASGDQYQNEFIQWVMKKSERLPLYIKYVADDIKSGRFTFYDEQKLPEGLHAYYRSLVESLRAGDTSELTNALFGVLCWSEEPLPSELLMDLLSSQYHSRPDAFNERFHEVMKLCLHVLRSAPAGSGTGWTFYHHSFRQYIQQSMPLVAMKGLQLLVGYGKEWKRHGSPYFLRYLPKHVFELAKRSADGGSAEMLFKLCMDESFFAAQQRTFQGDPQLPLETAVTGFKAAAEFDDPIQMFNLYTRFYLRKYKIQSEHPIEALNTSLERALQLASILPADHHIMWLILIAGILFLQGREAEAHEVLHRRLLRMRYDWERDPLLYSFLNIDMPWFVSLIMRHDEQAGIRIVELFLHPDEKGHVCTYVSLWSTGSAVKIAEQIHDPHRRFNQLCSIANGCDSKETRRELIENRILPLYGKLERLNEKIRGCIRIAQLLLDIGIRQEAFRFFFPTLRSVLDTDGAYESMRKDVFYTYQIEDISRIVGKDVHLLEEYSFEAGFIADILLCGLRIGLLDEQLKNNENKRSHQEERLLSVAEHIVPDDPIPSEGERARISQLIEIGQREEAKERLLNMTKKMGGYPFYFETALLGRLFEYYRMASDLLTMEEIRGLEWSIVNNLNCESEAVKVRLLLEKAKWLRQTGRPAEAGRIAEETLEAIQYIRDPLKKSDHLFDLTLFCVKSLQDPRLFANILKAPINIGYYENMWIWIQGNPMPFHEIEPLLQAVTPAGVNGNRNALLMAGQIYSYYGKLEEAYGCFSEINEGFDLFGKEVAYYGLMAIGDPDQAFLLLRNFVQANDHLADSCIADLKNMKQEELADKLALEMEETEMDMERFEPEGLQMLRSDLAAMNKRTAARQYLEMVRKGWIGTILDPYLDFLTEVRHETLFLRAVQDLLIQNEIELPVAEAVEVFRTLWSLLPEEEVGREFLQFMLDHKVFDPDGFALCARFGVKEALKQGAILSFQQLEFQSGVVEAMLRLYPDQAERIIIPAPSEPAGIPSGI